MKACITGCDSVLKRLLQHQKSKEMMLAKDNHGETGFMKACKYGRKTTVELLLKQSNRIDIITDRDNNAKTGLMKARDNNGETGLMKACSGEHIKTVASLINQQNYNDGEFQYFKDDTLGTEMFGVGDFWLEIREIIKISKIPC